MGQGALAAWPLNEFGLIDDAGETCGTALAPVAALMNHSCFPNAAKRFEGRRLVMYAIRDIGPDEEVCFSYLSRDIAGPERQQALWNTWRIPCRCTRCKASEFDATIAAFDARCGCSCAGFRIPDTSATSADSCWCLAMQLRDSRLDGM